MLLLVHALLLPTSLPKGTDRVSSIKQRVDLFLRGDFDRLLKPLTPTEPYDDHESTNPLHHIQRSSTHKPKELHPLSDATDRQAVEAQYQLTNRASVKLPPNASPPSNPQTKQQPQGPSLQP